MTSTAMKHPSVNLRSGDAGPTKLWNQARWPAAAGCTAATIAWLSADVLNVSRELFVLFYAIGAGILAFMFVRKEGTGLGAAARAFSGRAAVVTVITAGLLIATVLAQPGAPRAEGGRLVFELAWDGVVYGATDGVLLTVIPMVAVLGPRGPARWTSHALAMLVSVAVFVIYHLGFPEFRGVTLGGPIVAGFVFGAAYLASRNPLVPVLAHIAMHVAAVLHGPAGTAQLPPHY
jgi:hypothetical protein